MKLIRNRNDLLFIIFFVVGLIIIGGMLVFLENLWFPPEPTSFSSNQVLGIGFILICLSTLIHGFHPILLVRR